MMKLRLIMERKREKRERKEMMEKKEEEMINKVVRKIEL